jgi:hypothetical protein
MSWHCRLSHIGRNKPKRKISASVAAGTAAPVTSAPAPSAFDDEIPF